MAIIDDFADIASRMKGELAPQPKAKKAVTCRHCNGTKFRYSEMLYRYVICTECDEEEPVF